MNARPFFSRLAGVISIVLFAGALALNGCDSVLHKSETAEKAQSQARIAAQQGSFSGTVVVRSVGKSRIVVSLDENGATGAADGFVDRVFTLQAAGDIVQDLALKFTQANLTYVRGNLFISSSDAAENLHLLVENRDVLTLLRDNAREGSESLNGLEAQAVANFDHKREFTKYVGYGLAEQLVDRPDAFPIEVAMGSEIYVAPDVSCSLSRSVNVGGEVSGKSMIEACNYGCKAGGPGASSCSYGDCSVTCSKGYACCNLWGCNCCGAELPPDFLKG